MDVDAAFDALEAAARDLASGEASEYPLALTFARLRTLRHVLRTQPDATFFSPGGAVLMDLAAAARGWCTPPLENAAMPRMLWLLPTVNIIAHAVSTARIEADNAAFREARDVRASLALPLAFVVATAITRPRLPYLDAACDAALPLFAQILLPAKESWTEDGCMFARALLINIPKHPDHRHAVAACRTLAQLLPAAGVMQELVHAGGIEASVMRLWPDILRDPELAAMPPTSLILPYTRFNAVTSAVQWWLQPSPLPMLALASVRALRMLAALSESSDAAVAAAERVLVYCLCAGVQLPTVPPTEAAGVHTVDDPIRFQNFCESKLTLSDSAARAELHALVCHGLLAHMRHEASVVAACKLLDAVAAIPPEPGVIQLLAAAAQAHPRSDAVQLTVMMYMNRLFKCAISDDGPFGQLFMTELAAIGMRDHWEAVMPFITPVTAELARSKIKLMDARQLSYDTGVALHHLVAKGDRLAQRLAEIQAKASPCAAARTPQRAAVAADAEQHSTPDADAANAVPPPAAAHAAASRRRRAAATAPAAPRMSAEELAAATAAADAAAASLLAEEDAAASASQRKRGKKKKHKPRGGGAAVEAEEASGAAGANIEDNVAAGGSAPHVAPLAQALSTLPADADRVPMPRNVTAPSLRSTEGALPAFAASAALLPPVASPPSALPTAPVPTTVPHAPAASPMPPPAAAATATLPAAPSSCPPDAAPPPLRPWLLDEPSGIAAAAAPPTEPSLAEQLRLMKLQHEQMLRAQEQLLQEQEREREAKLCVICLDAAKDAVLMPCFHVCVCAGCAAALAARPGGGLCPVCRARIASYQRVFV